MSHAQARGQKRTRARLKSSASPAMMEKNPDKQSVASPPVKRCRSIPEDQLKLERVLKAVAKDATIIQRYETAKSGPHNASTSSKAKGQRKSNPATKTQNMSSKLQSVISKEDSDFEDEKELSANAKSKGRPKRKQILEKRDEKVVNAKQGKVQEHIVTPHKPTRTESMNLKSKTKSEKSDLNSKYFTSKKNTDPQTTSQKNSNVKKRVVNPPTRQKQPDSDSKYFTSEKNVSDSKTVGQCKPKVKTIGKKSQKQSNKIDKEARHVPPGLKSEIKKKSTPKLSVKRGKMDIKSSEPSPKKNQNPIAIPSPSKPLLKMDVEEDSDSDESDWEEVEDIGGEGDTPEKSQLPDEPVTITLQGPDLMKKKKKKEFDMEAYIRRRINRAEREIQAEMHKVHLLCLLSHGFHRNRLGNDSELHALGLSMFPFSLIDREVLFWDVPIMTKVANWFTSTFPIAPDLKEDNRNIRRTLIKRFHSRTVASEKELVFIFLIILRSIGVRVRLIYSLQPVSHKCATQLKPRKTKETDAEGTSNADGTQIPNPTSKKQTKQTKVPKDTKAPAHTSNSKASEPRTKNTKRRSSASKISYLEGSDDDEAVMKKNVSKKHKSESSSQEVVEVSSDSDFEIEVIKFSKSPTVSKGKRGKKEKIVSSDSDVEVTKIVNKENGSDMWVEVYMERAEGWIPIDPVRSRVNHPGELESRATQPVYYVLAYDNDNCIRDVTPRYSSTWMSSTRKLRVDNDWWDEVLLPYKPRNTIRLEAENKRLESQQLRKPLPTTVSVYKNHPLFALKRHLLKFEGIYPPEAVPVGFIKGEPIYSRENVHTLHTRETWLKEGRAVRVKEKPYKLVKARKKKSRRGMEFQINVEEEMAECFGPWQTEQYMPAPVYNGKIPRNEYGNLELFKPWMIPPGGVHLRLPGLNRIAKKMNLDCVPAMTGWDQHCGFSHPVLDGFIICEEHKDILIAAWDEQQEIDKERELEKREKRVLGNWKILTRGLVIRERMKIRFDLKEAKNPEGPKANDKDSEAGEKDGQKATDMVYAWPMNRQNETNQLSTSKDKSLFPTEEL